MQKNIKPIVPTTKLIEQVRKYIMPRTTDITWYNGSYITIGNSNILMINPIKIIVCKNEKTYVILSYGHYSTDDNEIFLYDKTMKISWLKVIEMLKKS